MTERGSSPLLAVMLLLLSGGLLLYASGRILNAGMAGVSDEYRYLQDYYQAQSSLQWGLQQNWRQQPEWQCRQATDKGWRSCLLWQTPDRGILQGQSLNGETRLWRLVQPAAKDSPSIIAVPRGWSDLCPLADERQCSPG